MNALIDPTKNGTITLPGAHQFTLTGFNWAGIPTDDEFARVLALCETVDRANEWCQGDVIVMRGSSEALAIAEELLSGRPA